MSATEVDDDAVTIPRLDKEQSTVQIVASSIRSGLAELELKTYQVLQSLENVKMTTTPTKLLNTTTESASGLIITGNDQSKNTQGNQKHKAKISISTSMSHIPLQNEHKLPSDILKLLEYLVAYTEHEDDPDFPLPALDDVSHLALISHSIVAYLSYLDHEQLLRLTNHIAGDTTLWLSMLFHFNNAASSFHADTADAILRVVRLAIIARCPGYLEDGIPALAQLCFYISENVPAVRLKFACRQLGISLDAIKVISATSSSGGGMDLLMLQNQIQNDLSANRTPLLIIADVGASLCGYVDNLTCIRDICKAYNIWLHATGHGLAALACVQSHDVINNIVNSIMVNLGSWLGVPSLPIVLLHCPLQNSALSSFESDPILSRRLNSLSLWTSLQALGRKSIAERLYIAFQTCDIIYGITAKCKGLSILSPVPTAQYNIKLSDVINPKNSLDVNKLFDAAVPVVVFQFDATANKEEATGNEKQLDRLMNKTYFDRLNSWMGQILQRDCPNFFFEVIDHSICGSCIRYCPLELGLGEHPPQSEHLERFAQSLETHVDILRATIKHKTKFIHLVEKHNLLRLVHLPEWAGMGGVRFVPEGWETLLTDQAKTELNKLNIDLVEALKSTDNAFSLGENADGLICVRFGMVTHETEVEELLELVVSVGKTVQENSRVLDTMSEIVKKGIEAATADLQRETEEKLWQEGILRHVPVFGRVFNWWSPAPKETGIKGRSLNLTQGVVESTENIYKYHMQISGAEAHQLHGNRSPPAPMVQTPVVSTANIALPVFPIVEPVATIMPTNTVPVIVEKIAPDATNAVMLEAEPNTGFTKINNDALANHARNISLSSNTSSSVPELIAVNSAINSN